MVLMRSRSAAHRRLAVDAFLRTIGRTVLAAVLFMFIAASTPAAPLAGQAADLRVLTFNIRYGTANDGENSWPNRRAMVGDLVEGFGPTVVGIQEALRFQLDELLARLPDLRLVGVGRDDGREAGEYAAILYDAGRLSVVDSGTFWFSDSPETPGSIGWGATIPRVCTWARFRDTASGRTFYVYNNHWDHQSQESRERSAALLLERIHARAAPDDPVIVTGDFNAGEDNGAVVRLVAGDGPQALHDTFRELHPDADRVGTFNGFDGLRDGPKIDAILVSAGWTVLSASIDHTTVNGRYPSDHFPVRAVLRRNPAR